VKGAPTRELRADEARRSGEQPRHLVEDLAADPDGGCVPALRLGRAQARLDGLAMEVRCARAQDHRKEP